MTPPLLRRIAQHRNGTFEGFSSKYGVRKLVWFEQHSTIERAILREKQIKKWRRAWKIELIEAGNPRWRDLAEEFGFEPLLRNGFPLSREWRVAGVPRTFPIFKRDMPAIGWEEDIANFAGADRLSIMFELLLILAGSFFVIFPQWKERRSARRLEELKSGAPEAFFEERRALEAYPSRGGWPVRLLGSAIVIFSVASLVLRHAN